MDHHPTWIDNLLPNQLLPGSYALLSEHPDTQIAVLFFHGFLGDAHGTWIDFQKMIDGEAARYPDWEKADLFFFHYSSFRKAILDIAAWVLKIIPQIFPSPPKELFTIPFAVPRVPAQLIEQSISPRTYKRLFLVAHSEGGAVLRRAVVLACQRKVFQDELTDAELNLFAPAHLGFEPKGWTGAVLSIGRIESLAMMALRLSPAFVEMKEKTVLKETENSTKSFLAEKPEMKALRARVLFGEKDDIVAKDTFTKDFPFDPEPGQDHVSICKPRPEYHKPLTFALGK